MTEHKKLQEYASPLTVLCVEDDPALLEKLETFLSRYFKRVVCAENGLEGLHRMESGSFDLVITDINMPVMNGIAMIEAIRKVHEALPVIVISAHDNATNLMALLKLRVDHFVPKPLNFHHLTQMLAETAIAVHDHHMSKAYVRELEAQNHKLSEKVIEKSEMLRNNSYLDPLTGLRNFCCFMTQLKDLHADRNQFIVLMLIDIDRLKEINDLFGTEVGDEVIVAFSEFLNLFTKGTTYKVFRTLGDQFGILDNAPFIDTDKYEHDLALLRKRIKALKIPIEKSGEILDIDVTIGMSLGQEHPLEHADMALEHAKKQKKDFAVYNTLIDTTETMREHILWKERIKEAIENRLVVARYQPIVDANGSIVKFEALMRIAASEGLISPALFLDIAVRSKQYRALSTLMIEGVIEAMASHDATVSINLAFEDIADKNFRQSLFETLRSSTLAGRIIFEIVESTTIEDYRVLREFIASCRSFGARVAIDDFGSGYSNFDHILEIRPDYIKIDGSLIQNIDVDPQSFILTRAITSFCHELGITVIAEYVHSEAVFELLRSIGIDEYQGYYFSEPAESTDDARVLPR